MAQSLFRIVSAAHNMNSKGQHETYMTRFECINCVMLINYEWGLAGVTIANNECIVIPGNIWREKETKESPIETKKERSQLHQPAFATPKLNLGLGHNLLRHVRHRLNLAELICMLIQLVALLGSGGLCR